MLIEEHFEIVQYKHIRAYIHYSSLYNLGNCLKRYAYIIHKCAFYLTFYTQIFDFNNNCISTGLNYPISVRYRTWSQSSVDFPFRVIGLYNVIFFRVFIVSYFNESFKCFIVNKFEEYFNNSQVRSLTLEEIKPLLEPSTKRTIAAFCKALLKNNCSDFSDSS